MATVDFVNHLVWYVKVGVFRSHTILLTLFD